MPLKILAWLFIGLVLNTQINARQPAVDPIMGLSIDEYKEVSPQDARGYSFNQRPQEVKREMASNEGLKVNYQHGTPDQLTTLDSAALIEHNHAASSMIIFIFAIMALPFCLWWIILKHLEGSKTRDHLDDLAVSLKDYRNARELENKNKDFIDKAS